MSNPVVIFLAGMIAGYLLMPMLLGLVGGVLGKGKSAATAGARAA